MRMESAAMPIHKAARHAKNSRPRQTQNNSMATAQRMRNAVTPSV